MDKSYLLTYHINNGAFDFEWFDTEKELKERVKVIRHYATITDAVHIKDAENIDFD